MWDVLVRTPRGSNSPRKFSMLLATFFVALLGYLFVSAPTVAAIDATWEGEDLTYDGNTYTAVQSKSELPNEVKNSPVVYQYIDNTRTPNLVYFIYFLTDVDDPKAENEANYIRYTLNPPPAANRYVNPTGKQPITLVPTVDPSDPDGTNTEAVFSSSCTIDGIGYIVCPLMHGLAEVMDFVFERIRGFLTVQPITNSADNPIYRIWQYSRDLANIAFIIGFMVIIYSYLVGGGFNGYEIRKILPRLAIAAILINVSYIVCAVAVDASNIAGYGVNQLFENVRDDVLPGSSTSADINWTSVTTWVLAGGVGVGVLTSVLPGATAGAAAAAGLWGLLSPFLVGGALLIMVTFFILAARQAIIILLIAVAPLAFAAFILPNTEKWFEKWRSLFFNMLIMFPAFGAVFGAAQLAGEVLIRSATSIEQVILGLGVMVAPLAITPLLLRLGGGVLNRFGGIVNNPQKGIYDRYKNYNAERRQDFLAKQNRLNAERNADGTLKGGKNLMRRAAYRQNLKKYNRQRLREADTGMANALYDDNDQGYETFRSRTGRQYARATGRAYTPTYRYGSAEIAEVKHDTNLLHGYTEARHGEHWQDTLRTDPRRAGMQTATRLAEGRAKITEENMASADESYLQQSLNTGTTARYAQLRDARVQTTVNKGVAEINSAEIDAAGKLALSTTVDNSRTLQDMKVRTFATEKTSEVIETRFKKDAEANWNYVSRVDANVQQLRLREVEATDTAKRAEEQYNSLIENIRATGGAAPQVASINTALADSVKSLKRDIDVQAQVQGSAKLIQQSDFTEALSTSVQLRQEAAGVDPRGAERVLAAAKAAVTKELITNTDNYQNTLDYNDVQSNIDELERRFKALPNDPSYMPQRVAYARLMAKNGSPGASRLMSVLSEYTQNLPPDEDNVILLKEILGGEQSIRTASRAFEVWANNERNENGDLYQNFDEVNNNVGIWKSITGQRFSSLVQPAQEHALKLLEADDKAKGTNNLQRLIERVSQDPSAMSAIKDKPLRMVQAVQAGQDPSSVQ